MEYSQESEDKEIKVPQGDSPPGVLLGKSTPEGLSLWGTLGDFFEVFIDDIRFIEYNKTM